MGLKLQQLTLVGQVAGLLLLKPEQPNLIDQTLKEGQIYRDPFEFSK